MAINWSKIPSNISIYTEDILRRMPDEFICDGGIEGLTSCKIEGKMGKYALIILYKFNEDIDHVTVKALSIDSVSKEGTIDIATLKETMIQEFLN